MRAVSEAAVPDRVLVVVAHPDDEAWLFGGTIATWAGAGAVVRVVCLTAGEKGGDRRGLVTGEQDVAALRVSELVASCAALGAEPRCLELPDGGLATFPVERGEAMIREQIAAFGPTRILTHGAVGEYGHLDHIAAQAWVRACASVPVWTPALDASAMHRVWRRLRKFGFEGVRKGLSEVQFSMAVDCAVALDGAASSAKRAALGAHASQLRDGDISSFLLPGLVDGLLHRETFSC